MKLLRNERGGISAIIGIILLIAIVYVGFSFGRPYIRYITFSSHAKDILEMELGNTDTVRQQVIELAEEANIPLDTNNLQVTVVQKLVKIHATYSEVVDFFGQYQYTMNFEVNEEY